MADPRIPFVVMGDGPRIPSGLARIARDLTARLVGHAEELGIRVLQVGIDPPGGWHWQGWDFYGFQETSHGYGRRELQAVLTGLIAETGQRPIVLAITDPARLYDITRYDEPIDVDDPREGRLQMDLWGYLPIDAHNVQNQIGGPAAEAVKTMDRVLAYGAYGAGVLQRTLARPVSHLPHGIEPVFRPHIPVEQTDIGFHGWRDPDAIVIGCVATNQPRKDLGLLFASVAELKRRGYRVQLWLHTDLLTKAWDVGQLAYDFCFQRHEVLVTTTAEGDTLTDEQLAARYCASTVTLAPGLGEGFGYPIVESLACGTPVVHGNYGGGVDLVPPMWLVEPAAWRLESCYALLRPVFDPKLVAAVLEIAIKHAAEPDCAPYCAGSVAHLHWQQVWPRWRAWIDAGL